MFKAVLEAEQRATVEQSLRHAKALSDREAKIAEKTKLKNQIVLLKSKLAALNRQAMGGKTAGGVHVTFSDKTSETTAIAGEHKLRHHVQACC